MVQRAMAFCRMLPLPVQRTEPNHPFEANWHKLDVCTPLSPSQTIGRPTIVFLARKSPRFVRRDQQS